MTTHETLTARAALWSWAARAVAYPSPELERAFAEQAERDRLAAISAAAAPDGTVATALAKIWTAVDEPDDRDISLAEEHTFLFGRHVRVPPYESSYVLEPGTDRSTHLSELGGFYAAFGLAVSSAHPDMPDHLGAECELLAVLLVKEAYALDQGWSSRAKLTRRARRKLVVEHLQRWLPAFASRLEKHHRRSLYPALVELIIQLLAVEERLLKAPRPPVLTGDRSGVP
jgi:TorA maturation chaperone TorD